MHPNKELEYTMEKTTTTTIIKIVSVLILRTTHIVSVRASDQETCQGRSFLSTRFLSLSKHVYARSVFETSSGRWPPELAVLCIIPGMSVYHMSSCLGASLLKREHLTFWRRQVRQIFLALQQRKPDTSTINYFTTCNNSDTSLGLAWTKQVKVVLDWSDSAWSGRFRTNAVVRLDRSGTFGAPHGSSMFVGCMGNCCLREGCS